MAHEELWEQLVVLDRQRTAKRAGCQYLGNPERYLITLLKIDYVVDLLGKRIFSLKPGSSPVPAQFTEQLCILAYLVNARDVPLARKLVKPESLPSGQFFFRGLHILDTEKLEKAFGKYPERLCQAAERLGAKQCQFGDASVELYILPRIPITIVIWRSDEEFAARASILFDQTAGMHMGLDALWAAGNLVVKMLTQE